ncbi:MAG: hypothetical protein ACO31I_03180 [Prochlorotrichaceae cyanobacterium]|jgi:hypothetical protein
MQGTIVKVCLGICLGLYSCGQVFGQGAAIANEVTSDGSTDTAETVKNDTQENSVTSSVQDPLNSPHPVPWSWVIETQSTMQSNGQTGVRYYRSPSLLSPDGLYAAYSRIQLHVEADAYRNRVDSVLFVENMRTGSLGVINPRSPFAEALGTATLNPSPASISLLVPVSWSEDSQKLLAREFDAILNTDDLTDYAIVWDRGSNQAQVIAPQGLFYDSAILLGWSRRNPEQILFQAGEFGQELWALWNVGLTGDTAIAAEDEPLVIGEQLVNPWDGPQAYWQPTP